MQGAIMLDESGEIDRQSSGGVRAAINCAASAGVAWRDGE